MQSTRTYGELREYAKEKETEGTVTSASTYNTRTYVTRTLYARTQVRSTGWEFSSRKPRYVTSR